MVPCSTTKPSTVPRIEPEQMEVQPAIDVNIRVWTAMAGIKPRSGGPSKMAKFQPAKKVDVVM